ncbi:MAG: PqqD family protein [Solirubrobacterales bacterium]
MEDGAVLLNMETRLYYSLNEPALDLWNLVDHAGTAARLAQLLSDEFAVDAPKAETTAASFFAQLERERLIGPAADDAPDAPAPAGGEKRPFADPELVKHDEPLHEVATSPFDPQLPLAE